MQIHIVQVLIIEGDMALLLFFRARMASDDLHQIFVPSPIHYYFAFSIGLNTVPTIWDKIYWNSLKVCCYWWIPSSPPLFINVLAIQCTYTRILKYTFLPRLRHKNLCEFKNFFCALPFALDDQGIFAIPCYHASISLEKWKKRFYKIHMIELEP